MNIFEAELLKKFENRIYPCKKDINKILEYLKREYNISSVDLRDIRYKRKINKFRINCINSTLNSKNLNTEDLDILMFIIHRDLKSSIFYDIDIVKRNEEFLYVIFETNTEYIDSNSNLLYNQVVLQKGITTEDIEKYTHNLTSFLLALDFNEKNQVI